MIFNTNIFKVVWAKLTAWLTPFVLRVKTISAWINALMLPTNNLYNDFLSYRDDVNYRLSITVQGVYLQKLLNDRYDIEQRRIVVQNHVQYFPIPFFLQDENKPQKLYTKSEAHAMTLYTQSETYAYTVDFVVKVPIMVPFVLDEMQGLIEAPGHKLESKTYKIIIV